MCMFWTTMALITFTCIVLYSLSDSLTSYRYTSRITTPLAIDDPVQRVRQQNLVARFNDMFAQDRLDALDTLRRYSDDHENNQRIIYTAISVSRTSVCWLCLNYKLLVLKDWWDYNCSRLCQRTCYLWMLVVTEKGIGGQACRRGWSVQIG